MNRYAVAVTMTKDVGSGTINIVTNLGTYGAATPEEARGMAFLKATEANPEHQVFSMAIMPIEQEQSA